MIITVQGYQPGFERKALTFKCPDRAMRYRQCLLRLGYSAVMETLYPESED